MRLTFKMLGISLVAGGSLFLGSHMAAATEEAQTPAAEKEQVQESIAGEVAQAEQAEQTTDMVKWMNEKKYPCMTCHQVDTKVVGPAFKDVAAQHKTEAEQNKAEVIEALSAKIKDGGKGVYGETPMPPNPMVSEEDRTAIAEWILSLPVESEEGVHNP